MNKNVFPILNPHTHRKIRQERPLKLKTNYNSKVNKYIIHETRISQYIQQECNVPALPGRQLILLDKPNRYKHDANKTLREMH